MLLVVFVSVFLIDFLIFLASFLASFFFVSFFVSVFLASFLTSVLESDFTSDFAVSDLAALAEALVLRYLERIADHALFMSDAINYIVTGKHKLAKS